MWAVCAFIGTAWISISVADRFGDFYDKTQDLEFIFHNATDVLLIVRGNDCFYYVIPEHRKPYLDNEYYKKLVESELGRGLNSPGGIDDIQTHHTSLQDVLNQFRDRLADFRCRDKDIYTMTLSDSFYDHIIQLVG